MRLDEARKILSVETKETVDVDPLEYGKLINSRYEHLYNTNSVEHGGSFYLQSKIFRAKEVIEEDFKRRHGISLAPGVFKPTPSVAGSAASESAAAASSTTTPPPS
jgi:import inner membrane translocase subunit TIM16